MTKPMITQTIRRGTTPRHSSLLMPKILAKFQRGHPQQRRQVEERYVQIGDFRPIFHYISDTMQDRDILTMKS